MAYGLKVYDEDGDSLTLTPEIMTLYESDRSAMPTAAGAGSTFEKTVTLPAGLTALETSLGAIAGSFIMNIDLTVYNLDVFGFFAQSWFLNDSSSFFTMNTATGVLAAFTPNKTSATNYDGLVSVFPSAYWDKRGLTSFTNLNIFAGTTYLAYDQSASGYETLYTLGLQGVENIDYAVVVSRYSE